jgi:hypothetical protein
MSFEPNDNMNTIHLGNYEEFFVLYMDNELSEEQVKMVDEFLTANPDLRAEFEILLSTKLPLEDFSFDKQDLLAESMKLTSVDEELLLYIDNELPSDKKKTIELELASNKDYQLQHQVLLQTKLHSSEHIAYPNKKELYRRTERVVAFRPWMRVAAAVIVIAAAGILYLMNNPAPPVQPPLAGNQIQSTPKKDTTAVKSPVTEPNPFKQDVAAVNPSDNDKQENHTVRKDAIREKNPVEQPVIARNDKQETVEEIIIKRTNDVAFNEAEAKPKLEEPKVSLNNVAVTSSLLPRNTNETSISSEGPIASNRKGSVKGFLRKATRMIEKRTGFDPANENGELLIGAVAISLK